MEWISTSEIVASAKIQLGIDHNGLDNYFKLLAVEAEKQIKSRQTISKHHTEPLTVHDNVLELPLGFVSLVKILGFQAGDSKGIVPNYLPSSFYRCEKESPNLKNDLTNGDGQKTEVWYSWWNNAYAQGGTEFLQEYYPYTFELQRNHVFFSDDCNFETVELSYHGYNFDENGDLQIPENHERAIRSYIAFNYKLEDNYATRGQLQTYERHWAQQKANVRGEDGIASREMQKFGEMVLRSLIAPRRMLY